MGSLTPAGNGATVDEVFRAYTAICTLAASTDKTSLAHCLILAEPLSIAGEAPVIAASIASAASLCIEADGDAMHRGIRSGAIDFTVNSLDEALRALKNEVRKGLSIAVCLEGRSGPVLDEMLDRGVQPDYVCGLVPEEFLLRGARLVHFGEGDERVETSWSVAALPGKWLPVVDQIVAAILPTGDTIRHRWLQRAPRYLGRRLRTEHYLHLTPDESALATTAIRAARLGTQVTFRSGERVESIAAG